MKCKACKKDVADGVKFCPECGANQSGASKDKVGALILDCQHCEGTGECKKGKTHDRVHSCEYCVAKSGIKPASLFPHVPCGYCQGKGKQVIDLKIGQPQQQQKRKEGQNG